ncbi:pyridoxamine 5'-phosphate oxidase family protein [Sulfurospirillum cavolei]|uniref:pyridoxamine 5'-phosphate oxidase family protein n=1 Tax=Sulfurospirillum cavolei TaxID=366522 RepID=UPI0005A9DDEF|nr:pyridoxamine 5'-phosphate oxidase family protein [Sulfurospirillum cavolei]
MLDPKIEAFLRAHHLLTLATCQNHMPYCASCFYAFIKESATFVIATNAHTRHGREALENVHVAGTVALETKIVGKIQGAQFTGVFKAADEAEKKAYLRRFPYAIAMKPELWSIAISYLKFTDNTLGFGKKLEFFAS